MGIKSAMTILYIIEWIVFALLIWEGIRERFDFWLWLWTPICYWGLTAIFNGIFESIYPAHGFIKSIFIIFGSIIGIFVALGIWALLSSIPNLSGGGGGGYSEEISSYSENDSSDNNSSPRVQTSLTSAKSISNKTENEQIYDLMPGARRIEKDNTTGIKTQSRLAAMGIAEIRPETKSHYFGTDEHVSSIYDNNGRQIFEVHHEIKQSAFVPDEKIDTVYNSDGIKVLEVRHEEEKRGFVGEEYTKVDNIYDNNGKQVASVENQTRNRLLAPDEHYKEINPKDKKS
jgi:hypothetical protein